MSRTLKWILGALAVLVVVVLIAGAVFMWQNHMTWWGPRSLSNATPGAPSLQDFPAGPQTFGRYPRYHMDNWGWRMPMHGYDRPYAFSPMGTGFFMLGGLFHLLFPLGILALVAYLFYQMGKRAGAASGSSAAPINGKPSPVRKVARR